MSLRSCPPRRKSLKLGKTNYPARCCCALDVIAESQIRHAKQSLCIGCHRAFCSRSPNANETELPLADYVQFSRPSDKKFLAGIAGAKLNILHLHVKPASSLDQFQDFHIPDPQLL